MPTFADVVRLHDKPQRRYVRTPSGNKVSAVLRSELKTDITRLPLEVLVQVCKLLPYNDLVHLCQVNLAMNRRAYRHHVCVVRANIVVF